MKTRRRTARDASPWQNMGLLGKNYLGGDPALQHVMGKKPSLPQPPPPAVLEADRAAMPVPQPQVAYGVPVPGAGM